MEGISGSTLLNVVITVAYGVGAAWRGYRRRRAYWTRGSWLTLGALIVGGLATMSFSLIFAAAVDSHAGWVGAPGSSTRSYWVLLGLGSMVGGGILTAGPLAWFAVGEPTRQLSLFGARDEDRRALPVSDRQAGSLPSSPPSA